MLLPPGARCIVPADSARARGAVLTAHRAFLEVTLDDGTIVWADVAAVERPPNDLYERAILDPMWFYEDLFELERDRRREILSAIGAGEARVAIVSRVLVIDPSCVRHFSLLRRLLFPGSFAVGIELVPDCPSAVGGLVLLLREADRAGLCDRISTEVLDRMRAVLREAPESAGKDYLLAFFSER